MQDKLAELRSKRKATKPADVVVEMEGMLNR